MKINTILAVLLGTISLSACMGGDATGDKSRDLGADAKPLSELVAGIWVDPNGCQHWIIDDGMEGYLSARLQPNGKPVCGYVSSGVAYGPYKSGGSGIMNSFETRPDTTGNRGGAIPNF